MPDFKGRPTFQGQNLSLLPENVFFNGMQGIVSVTNVAAALTELTVATTRQQLDLTYATQARLVVGVSTIATAGTEMRAQYSTDGGTNWNYLDGASGPTVTGLGTTGLKIGSWVNLASGAKADVLVRLVTIGGDGVADPAFRTISLQIR